MLTLRDPRKRAELLLVVCLLIVALAARYAGRQEVTRDMEFFLAWHGKLQNSGGWRGLGTQIGNYNAPFMYMLWLASLLPGPIVIKIKLVYAVFDILLSYFTYRLVAMHRGRRTGRYAALVVLLLPTVVLNASTWGQIDSMWASFAVGGIWQLARGRGWTGVLLCTVSLALKPHGIFVFPLVGLLVLAGRLKARTLLAVPLTWAALSLPAVLLGRSPVELLTIYSMERQAGIVRYLTSDAPSVYAFLVAKERLDLLRQMGYAVTAAMVLGVILAVVASRVRLDPTRIVTLATLFSIMIPFGLPGMHERYFFLADPLSVILAFYRPWLWFVPLLVQTSSLLSYLKYLFGPSDSYLDLKLLAALMLAALLSVGYALGRDVLTGPFEEATAERPDTTGKAGKAGDTAEAGEPGAAEDPGAGAGKSRAAPAEAPRDDPLPPTSVGNTITG